MVTYQKRWQAVLNTLLDPVWLSEKKKPAPKKKAKKRARNKSGHYIADDPNTPKTRHL